MNNVTIERDALFLGSIRSGSLLLSDETPSSQEFSYPSGTNALTVRQDLSSYLPSSGNAYLSAVGSYGGKPLIRIATTLEIKGDTRRITITIFFQDGTNSSFYRYTGDKNDGVNSSGALSFRLTSGGKTFKLIDLPTEATESGTVYRSGNYLMIKP